MTKEDKGFYTVEQVANKLKVHWQTALDYIRNGELEAMRLGKGYRIPIESFERFVSERMADVSLSAIASSKKFAAKPSGSKYKRYMSVLIVPAETQKDLIIPANPDNDKLVRDVVERELNILGLKPDIDGMVSKLNLENGELYFRSSESGAIFLRQSLFEPDGEVYIRNLLSINFRALKIAHDIYTRLKLKGPVFIKFRLEGIEDNVLKTGSFRILSIEDQALGSRIEVNEGPVELKTDQVADLVVQIVLRALRGFGNNRLTVDTLKDFLQKIIEGKE